MHAIIRPANEADAPALVELRKKLFAETPFMLWEPGEFTQTAEDERKRIATQYSRPNSVLLLAEEGAEVVGLVSAVGGERNRLRHVAVLALGVVMSHWGRGIATAMVRQAVAWSLGAGLKRLELTVHTSNLAAISVYLRCGFAVEGIRRSSLLVDGQYVDEYLMAVIHAG